MHIGGIAQAKEKPHPKLSLVVWRGVILLAHYMHCLGVAAQAREGTIYLKIALELYCTVGVAQAKEKPHPKLSLVVWLGCHKMSNDCQGLTRLTGRGATPPLQPFLHGHQSQSKSQTWQLAILSRCDFFSSAIPIFRFPTQPPTFSEQHSSQVYQVGAAHT